MFDSSVGKCLAEIQLLSFFRYILPKLLLVFMIPIVVVQSGSHPVDDETARVWAILGYEFMVT